MTARSPRVNLATGQAPTPITVGKHPAGIAITPSGATAYVANAGDGTVTPISLPASRPGTPIATGSGPSWIATTRLVQP